MIVIICILEGIINHLGPMTDVNEPITETEQRMQSVIEIILDRFTDDSEKISSRGLLLDKDFLLFKLLLNKPR